MLVQVFVACKLGKSMKKMKNTPSLKSPILSVVLCVAQKYISMEHRVPIGKSGMTIVPNIPSTSTCIVNP